MSSPITSFQDVKNTLDSLKKDTLLLELNDNSIDNLTTIINNKIQNYIVNNINKLSNELSSFNILNDLPIGTTLMWNNDNLPTISNQNTKWVWCDGENNTPDLRLKFPVGNEISNNGEINIFDTSGYDGIITKNNIPIHHHDITINSGGKHTHTLNSWYYRWNTRSQFANNKPPEGTSEIALLSTDGNDKGSATSKLTASHNHTVLASPKHIHDISSKENGGSKIFYPRFAYVNFITKISIAS